MWQRHEVASPISLAKIRNSCEKSKRFTFFLLLKLLSVQDIDSRSQPLTPRAVLHLLLRSHLPAHQVIDASVAFTHPATIRLQLLVLRLLAVVKDNRHELGRHSWSANWGTSSSIIYLVSSDIPVVTCPTCA